MPEVLGASLQTQLDQSDLTCSEGSFNQVLGSNAVDTSSLNHDSVPGDLFPEVTPQAQGLQDRTPLTEDPESPRDILHENVLVLFPLALFFVLPLFGLVITFSK